MSPPLMECPATCARWSSPHDESSVNTHRLAELNLGPAHAPDLLSNDLVRVIVELCDPEDFDKNEKELAPAVPQFTRVRKVRSVVCGPWCVRSFLEGAFAARQNP